MKFSTLSELLSLADRVCSEDAKEIATFVRLELTPKRAKDTISHRGLTYKNRHNLSQAVIEPLIAERKLEAIKQHRTEIAGMSLPDSKRIVEDFLFDNNLPGHNRY
jgi:hypothetical protein